MILIIIINNIIYTSLQKVNIIIYFQWRVLFLLLFLFDCLFGVGGSWLVFLEDERLTGLHSLLVANYYTHTYLQLYCFQNYKTEKFQFKTGVLNATTTTGIYTSILFQTTFNELT